MTGYFKPFITFLLTDPQVELDIVYILTE